MSGLEARLRQGRESKNLTQAQVAERFNCSHDVISSYETGRRKPPADILIMYSQLLGVSIDFLVKGKDFTFPPDLQLIWSALEQDKQQLFLRIFKDIQQLSPKQLNLVLNNISNDIKLCHSTN